MQPHDDYLPDPPRGLGYGDFRAARARFLARLTEQAKIARLERAVFDGDDPVARRPRTQPGSNHELFAGEQPNSEPAGGKPVSPVGEESG